MMERLAVYEFLKIIHLLADFSWMAGLFYLPRLMVYHVEAEPGSQSDTTFITMERRLLKAIMRPAAVVSVVSGLGLIHVLVLLPMPLWLVAKLLAVVGMLAVHGMLERYHAAFARGERRHSGRFYRVLNEVPTVLLVVIVAMVVARPWS
jgi:putative membrane protein